MTQVCSHGKSMDEECLACNVLWRIDQRRDRKLAKLTKIVGELQHAIKVLDLDAASDDYARGARDAYRIVLTALEEE